jgi:hypothetical protein
MPAFSSRWNLLSLRAVRTTLSLWVYPTLQHIKRCETAVPIHATFEINMSDTAHFVLSRLSIGLKWQLQGSSKYNILLRNRHSSCLTSVRDYESHH